MALPTPPAYTTPIPNNPFYSNPSYLLQGATGPYVVGAGLFVDPAGTISSTGGGGGAVASIVGGAGIGVSSPTGNVVLTNTGVTSLIAGSGITLSGNTGNITISATAASGTVTAVNTGTGLTGGPVTTTGTISIANTGVAAATYTNPTLTVNAQGQITAASSGTAVGSVVGTAPISVTTALGTATVSISAATTAACGAVQLSDSTSSLSSATAATSLAVKTAFDVAVAAIPKACITAKGTLLTGTGPSVVAPLALGTDGYVLTADSTCAEGIKWSTATIPNATPLAAGKIVGCTVARGFGIIGLTALGVEALDTLSVAPANPNGSVAIGYKTMKLTVGPNNVAIGDCALYGPSSFGGDNVAIGTFALRNAGGTDGNVAIGVNSGCNLSTGSYNVLIGAETQAPVATGSCQLVIGSGVGFCWLTGCSTKAIQPAAGIIDCTASCGTNNYVLTSQGNAIEWKSVSSALAVPNYGSYISTVTQTVGTLSVGQAVTLTAVAQNNFTLVGGSQITAGVAGKYNIQISLQIISTGGGGGDVEVWFVKNGLAVSNSNTRYSVKNANEEEVAALNFVDTFAAGDNIQVFWASNNSLMTLAALASTMGGPAIPSAIVTIVPVGA